MPACKRCKKWFNLGIGVPYSPKGRLCPECEKRMCKLGYDIPCAITLRECQEEVRHCEYRDQND